MAKSLDDECDTSSFLILLLSSRWLFPLYEMSSDVWTGFVVNDDWCVATSWTEKLSALAMAVQDKEGTKCNPLLSCLWWTENKNLASYHNGTAKSSRHFILELISWIPLTRNFKKKIQTIDSIDQRVCLSTSFKMAGTSVSRDSPRSRVPRY